MTVDIDGKLIVSIYAAVVSTAVALWRVYEFWDDKRGKIKVHLNTSTIFPVYQNRSLGDASFVYDITIINRSKHKRHIENPGFVIDKSNNGKKELWVADFNSTTNFPYSIESGEKYNHKWPYDGIRSEALNAGATKFRVIVRDTHGKKYLSNWVNI